MFLVEHPAHWKIVCVSCGSQLLFNFCFSSVFRHGTWQAMVSCHCSSGEDLDEHWTATASYRSADGRRAADTAPLMCSCEVGLHGRQARQSPRWISAYLLAKPNASVTEVHSEFQKSCFDLSRTTLHRIMLSQHRPVRPLHTHKVRMVNCKRRVDFCIDILSRLHHVDQLQGVHRRITVKLRRVPDHMALDPARLCFQDEALMKCCQKLVPQDQRVWIDRGLSKDFATTDERLSQHMVHKESQNNPGMMVGVVRRKHAIHARERHLPATSPDLNLSGRVLSNVSWQDSMTRPLVVARWSATQSRR